MIPGVKNAASWWSSFVYSLSVDPFHDVLGIYRLQACLDGLRVYSSGLSVSTVEEIYS